VKGNQTATVVAQAQAAWHTINHHNIAKALGEPFWLSFWLGGGDFRSVVEDHMPQLSL
jgi:hypothetical protein